MNKTGYNEWRESTLNYAAASVKEAIRAGWSREEAIRRVHFTHDLNWPSLSISIEELSSRVSGR